VSIIRTHQILTLSNQTYKNVNLLTAINHEQFSPNQISITDFPNLSLIWPWSVPYLAPMWSLSGPDVALIWPLSGPDVVLIWPRCGPYLAPMWPWSGPDVVLIWPRCGPYLAPMWPRSGSNMSLGNRANVWANERNCVLLFFGKWFNAVSKLNFKLDWVM